MTTSEFTHLSEVYDFLAKKVGQHGIHQQTEELIEEFINRANGLAGVNPGGLDALLAEYTSRAHQHGMSDQAYDVGESCISAAFSVRLTERSPTCTSQRKGQ